MTDEEYDELFTSTYPKEEVQIITRRGFNISSVTVANFIPVDGMMLIVGDVQCYDFDQDDLCDGWAALGRIEGGALAGREFSISRGVVTIHDAGRTIQIDDPDIERARELAESFVEV